MYARVKPETVSIVHHTGCARVDAGYTTALFSSGESVMKKFAIGLLSAAALATTILLVRQQKEDTELPRLIPAGETQSTISLERIRELGL